VHRPLIACRAKTSATGLRYRVAASSHCFGQPFGTREPITGVTAATPLATPLLLQEQTCPRERPRPSLHPTDGLEHRALRMGAPSCHRRSHDHVTESMSPRQRSPQHPLLAVTEVWLAYTLEAALLGHRITQGNAAWDDLRQLRSRWFSDLARVTEHSMRSPAFLGLMGIALRSMTAPGTSRPDAPPVSGVLPRRNDARLPLAPTTSPAARRADDLHGNVHHLNPSGTCT
jgi:hypothetical protein